jgi:predicted 3-demethylubiquinone-9 3-methyltransferase (glyoxalase superfamily)
MSGITPCLWFDGNAEEAAKFYASCTVQRVHLPSLSRRLGGPGQPVESHQFASRVPST